MINPLSPPAVIDATAPMFIRAKAATKRYSMSLSYFYQRVADHSLPPPIKRGRSSFWRTTELDAAVAKMLSNKQRRVAT